MRIWLPVVAFVVMSQGILCAQSFEAASVRENPGPTWSVRLGFSSSGPRASYQVWSVPELIQEAFGLKRYAVIMPASGVPTAFYDIAAKAEGNDTLTRDQFRPLLQKLLADRFALKIHRETRELPVYAMAIGKSGVKFKESEQDEPEKNFGGVYGRNQPSNFSRGLWRCSPIESPWTGR